MGVEWGYRIMRPLLLARRGALSSSGIILPPPSGQPIPANGVITTGGTYTGTRISTSSGPVLTIQTDQPVVLDGCTLTRTVPSTTDLISELGTTDITIVRCTITDAESGIGRLINPEFFTSFVFENNFLERTGGIYFQTPGETATTIRVARNKVKNIQGLWDQPRQFVQFNNVKTLAAPLVEWNEVINEHGLSRVEDVISVFDSDRVIIRNNYLQGGFPLPGETGAYSGSGFLFGDQGGSYSEGYDNQIVGVINVGIGIVGGVQNKLHHNKVISYAGENVGMAVYDPRSGSGESTGPDFAQNQCYSNTVGFRRADGSRNDWWIPGCEGLCSNTSISGSITQAMEDAEYDLWLQKLAANGITIGV